MSGTALDATAVRILDAALDAFVIDGFAGTSTDQIAAGAAASKQTIYKRFGDKASLFRALVDHVLISARAQIVDIDVTDCWTGEEAVRRLARQLAGSILTPRVQRLRRLIIAEAARFPDIGLAYYEGAFLLTLAGVGRVLDGLVQRGLLRIDDTVLAANQLAGLTLWLPTNRIMMTGRLDSVTQAEIDAAVESGVRVFMAAYAAG